MKNLWGLAFLLFCIGCQKRSDSIDTMKYASEYNYTSRSILSFSRHYQYKMRDTFYVVPSATEYAVTHPLWQKRIGSTDDWRQLSEDPMLLYEIFKQGELNQPLLLPS